jgi:hypothetical protein
MGLVPRSRHSAPVALPSTSWMLPVAEHNDSHSPLPGMDTVGFSGLNPLVKAVLAGRCPARPEEAMACSFSTGCKAQPVQALSELFQQTCPDRPKSTSHLVPGLLANGALWALRGKMLHLRSRVENDLEAEPLTRQLLDVPADPSIPLLSVGACPCGCVDPWTELPRPEKHECGICPRIRVLPLSVGPSHRLGRRIGWHRVMTLEMPPVSRSHRKRWEEFVRMLCTRGFELMGQRWHFLHGRWGKNEAVFVAQLTSDRHVPTASAVRSWHIPRLTMGIAKYAARLDLLLSATTPCLRISAERFMVRDMPSFGPWWSPVASESEARLAVIPDEVSRSSGALLTDGCGFVSVDVAKRMVDHWHRRVLGAPPPCECVPSAFQGRIGGFKGVWAVHPELEPGWVVCRESQHKVILDTPLAEQLDVEVMRWVGGCGCKRCSSRSFRDRKHGALNEQILPLLLIRGVPFRVFEQLFDEALGLLRRCARGDVDAVEFATHGARAKAATRWTDLSRNDQDLFLIHHPRLCKRHPEVVLPSFHRVAHDGVEDLRGTLKVPVTHSRRLLILPDPTGKLKRGQAFLRLSQASLEVYGRELRSMGLELDSSSARVRKDGAVLGKCAAVRSPTFSPHEILALECVDLDGSAWRDALVDVLVLSCDPDAAVPDVARLSGGDFDGDEVLLLWDDRIVAPLLAEEAVRADGKPAASPAGEAEVSELDLVTHWMDSVNEGSMVLGATCNRHKAAVLASAGRWTDMLEASARACRDQLTGMKHARSPAAVASDPVASGAGVDEREEVPVHDILASLRKRCVLHASPVPPVLVEDVFPLVEVPAAWEELAQAGCKALYGAAFVDRPGIVADLVDRAAAWELPRWAKTTEEAVIGSLLNIQRSECLWGSVAWCVGGGLVSECLSALDSTPNH